MRQPVGVEGRRLAALGLTVGLAAGCGQFGLPTGRDPADIQRGDPAILDVDPKLGSQGTTGLVCRVVGIDTFFDDTLVVTLPLLPEVEIVDVAVLGLEEFEMTLDIPADAPLVASPLVVSTRRDGTLSFEAGFTVVR